MASKLLQKIPKVNQGPATRKTGRFVWKGSAASATAIAAPQGGLTSKWLEKQERPDLSKQADWPGA